MGEALRQFQQGWLEKIATKSLESLPAQRGLSQDTTATMPTSKPRTRNSEKLILREQSDVDDEMDDDSQENPNSPVGSQEGRPIVVATDFGTTYSPVGFAKRDENGIPIVKMISIYSGDPMVTGYGSMQVLTESCYPTAAQMKYLESRSIAQNVVYEHTEEDPIDSSDSDDENMDKGSEKQDTPDILEHDTAGSLPSNVIWGYEVQSIQRLDVDLREYNRVRKSKLLLDAGIKTQRARDELSPILQQMKLDKIIKKDDKVIVDYLVCLLEHTKQQLAQEDSFDDDTSIEHVLTIPVIWTAKACRRMQSAMETAIKVSGLGTMLNFSFVSEPEAAAQCVIVKQRQSIQVRTNQM
jgi:hypothetical protein